MVCISIALVLASIPPQIRAASVESVEQVKYGKETKTDLTEKASGKTTLEAEVLKTGSALGIN